MVIIILTTGVESGSSSSSDRDEDFLMTNATTPDY